MSSITFYPFSRLPLELRNQIWAYSMPTTISISIKEGVDMEVTSVSAPEIGQMLATKESRDAFLRGKFSGPVGTYSTEVEDYVDFWVNEDTTLQLVISPSSGPTLHITWTDLDFMLPGVLRAIKKLHVACSQPERLARLFSMPEGGLVSPGNSHWDEDDMWLKETVASDRKCRESFQQELKVTTGVATLEEISNGSEEEMKEWELVGEEVVKGFGLETQFSTTKAFALAGAEKEVEVKEWREMREKVGEEVGGGVALTEEAIARLIQETGWEPRSSTPSSLYSGDEKMYYDGELWLTVP
ncbi:hypothetical protein FB567DRAFT_272198 [Paraphoma chrysanthemicola]|uniref:2EXR domain-containing protein n=1 Tax=Paraphoma chrysanthemicola TaxID=798071 RepID=A0A8K0RE29_9PLEO|nr:hypothetical protein FB567DRAFT_272198 [Paraphoma chrysanthemicola]